MKKKRAKSRGSKRMRELGLRQVSAWFEASEFAALQAHCRGRRHAVATFVRSCALQAIHFQEIDFGDGVPGGAQ